MRIIIAFFGIWLIILSIFVCIFANENDNSFFWYMYNDRCGALSLNEKSSNLLKLVIKYDLTSCKYKFCFVQRSLPDQINKSSYFANKYKEYYIIRQPYFSLFIIQATHRNFWTVKLPNLLKLFPTRKLLELHEMTILPFVVVGCINTPYEVSHCYRIKNYYC